MPWKVVTVMSQRKEFVSLASAEDVNISELCRRFDISRKTGYKWLERFRADRDSVLDDVVKTGEAIEQGGSVAEEKGTYFTSFEAFRKALTLKRLELLHIIKARKPSSINELARVCKEGSEEHRR